MDVDDCICVSAASPKTPHITKGMCSEKSEKTSCSPATPVSSKKLVQARLPFKPLHTGQITADDNIAKKRKLNDSNPTVHPANKTSRKMSAEKFSRPADEDVITLVDSNDNCSQKSSDKSDLLKDKVDQMDDADSKTNHSCSLSSSEKSNSAFAMQDDELDVAVDTVNSADICPQTTDVIDPQQSLHHEQASLDGDDICKMELVSPHKMNDDSDYKPCATSPGSDSAETAIKPDDSVHDGECVSDANDVTADSDHSSAADHDAASAEHSSSDVPEIACAEVGSASKPSVTLTEETGNERPASDTSAPAVSEESSGTAVDGKTDTVGQPSKATKRQSLDANKRKSLDKKKTPSKDKSLLKEEKEKQKEEKEKQKEEKEKQKAEEKEKREKEKEEAKLKKLQEKQEKEKEREKEKAEKKKQKEDERLRKQEQILEEKKKKEEAKLEEKKKKDEKKEKQEEKVSCLKEKEMMQKFFVKPTKDAVAVKPASETKTGPFMDFQVKENMRLAPLVRLNTEDQKLAVANVETALYEEVEGDGPGHYLKDLHSSSYVRRKYPPTWPRHILPTTEDVIIMPNGEQTAGCWMRAKLFQFHENYRPAYYGTWRKRSKMIRPRNPWRRDAQLLDYDVDSDEEWEEEEPGESLSHSEHEDSDEEEVEPDEDNDGFFVPHGYLSEGEGCDDDDDDDDKEKGSPNRLKAIQLAKARNWEAEMHSKKLEVLQPIILGICWWTPDVTAPDPIYNKLKEFKVHLFEPTPIVTSVQSVGPHNSNGKKEKKNLSGKNIKWLPVPEAALCDLVALVHGNRFSIKKMINEFQEFWRCRTPPAGNIGSNNSTTTTTAATPPPETVTTTTTTTAATTTTTAATTSTTTVAAAQDIQYLLSKRQLEAKIREIAVYELRQQSYPKHKLWYVSDDVLNKLQVSSPPVPTQWKWLTKFLV